MVDFSYSRPKYTVNFGQLFNGYFGNLSNKAIPRMALGVIINEPGRDNKRISNNGFV
jgi:hypothetical protein